MISDKRSIEDRLLVIETKIDFLATKAELVKMESDIKGFVFTLVAPIYLLIIGQLAAAVWYFATH